MASAVALLLLFADLQTPGEELLAALKQKATPELLKQAGELYRFPGSKEEAQALFDAACAATKASDAPVRIAALRALATMGDPRAAEFIEPFLREKNPDASEKKVVLTAIEAAGRLRVGALVSSLLNLAKGAKDMTVADEALLALGAFHQATIRERKQLVDRVLLLSQSLKRSRRKWNRLRPPALRSLQLLTGQRMNNVEQFAEWWALAKSRKDPFIPREDES